MNEKDKQLMAIYNISAENEIVYRYLNYKYQKLEDAIQFAKKNSGHNNAELSEPESTKVFA